MYPISNLLNKAKSFEENGFAWIGYLLIISLFFSRAGLAISSILLLAYAIYSYVKKPFSVSFKLSHILFFTIYAAYLIGVLFANENINYGLQLLFKNATFIVLPLAFLLYRQISTKTVHNILLLFLFSAFICVSINTVDVLMHFNQFLKDVGNSKNVIPRIGPSHSELGLLSVVAFVFGSYLVLISKNQKFRVLLYLMLALLFIELHIIAYRFSVISIYLIIALYSISELIRNKNFKAFCVTILIAVVTLYAVSLIPSVKKRFQNSMVDLTTISQNRNPNFQSVTQRILAVSCAVEVIKTHPWLGVSPSNASQAMQEQYNKNSYLLIPENRMFIHNQFMYYVLCFGIPFGGLVAFALIFLLVRNYSINPILFWAMLPFLFHMIMENTLDRQITANAFIFLFLLIDKKEKILTF